MSIRVRQALLLVVSMLLSFLSSTVHAVELSEQNYAQHIAGKKKVFINFYSTSCGHCKNMKAAWEQLVADYADNDDYLVASVNCRNGENNVWCREVFEIAGYPTLLYGNPQYKRLLLEEYETSRDYESLATFARDIVFATPDVCTLENQEYCSRELKERLAKLVVLPEGHYVTTTDTFHAMKYPKDEPFPEDDDEPPSSVQGDEL